MKNLAETLRHLADTLNRLDLAAAQHTVLESAGQRLETAIKQSLSNPPSGDHSTPWIKTGKLRDSIARDADNQTLIVGSTDPVAVFQELGTRTIPPRPFLAPAASSLAEDLVQEVRIAISTAVRGATK
ncbi:MAG: HK97 gp10 family phage protein [Acetobacteraceae bacterium]|nr:HK97 gp10 family phage protein [Acetobacteraceae bacterium]